MVRVNNNTVPLLTVILLYVTAFRPSAELVSVGAATSYELPSDFDREYAFAVSAGGR